MTGRPPVPMLAVAGVLPAGPGWAFEPKWDGVRAIAVVREAGTRFYARSGAEITSAYPELTDPGLTDPGRADPGRADPGLADSGPADPRRADPGLADSGPADLGLAESGPGDPVPADPGPAGVDLVDTVLDGEVVAFDAAGRPSFQTLAERMHVRDPRRAARLAATTPVTFLVFDLLRLHGVDLLDVPYAERRRMLDELVPGGRFVVAPSFDDGPATLAASGENGLEGVVAKRLASPYRPGVRSPDWVKVKLEQTADLVVGGWRPGVRTIGALLVGVPAPGGLRFRGRVGGGISVAAERDLLALLRPLVSAASPFADPIPRDDARTAIWVRPEVVVEVRFSSRTRDGRLRFPRLLRLRPDKPAQEVIDE